MLQDPPPQPSMLQVVQVRSGLGYATPALQAKPAIMCSVEQDTLELPGPDSPPYARTFPLNTRVGVT